MRYSLSTSNRLHQVHQAKLRASANFKIYQDFRRPINSSNPFSLNLAIIIQIIKKKHFSLIAYLNKKKKIMLLEFSKPNRNNLLPAIKRISKKRKEKIRRIVQAQLQSTRTILEHGWNLRKAANEEISLCFLLCVTVAVVQENGLVR